MKHITDYICESTTPKTQNVANEMSKTTKLDLKYDTSDQFDEEDFGSTFDTYIVTNVKGEMGAPSLSISTKDNECLLTYDACGLFDGDWNDFYEDFETLTIEQAKKQYTLSKVKKAINKYDNE